MDVESIGLEGREHGTAIYIHIYTYVHGLPNAGKDVTTTSTLTARSPIETC